MPLIKADGRLIYFAHVPKCAGTSVARYLEARGQPMAFSDRRYLSIEAPLRWTRSSPQHAPLEALERLFPPGFFDASFALVRHPVARIASVYLFQRDKEGTVPADMRFGDWLSEVEAARAAEPFIYDNHTRPMVEFIPEGAHVFRVEDGLAPVAAWLEAQLGPAPDAAGIGHHNSRDRLLGAAARPLHVTAQERAIIARIYAADFERFGYDSALAD